jgi:hypothetical protein
LSLSTSSVNDSGDSYCENDEANWYEGDPQAFLSANIKCMTSNVHLEYPQAIDSHLAEDNQSFFGHREILDNLEETSPRGVERVGLEMVLFYVIWFN